MNNRLNSSPSRLDISTVYRATNRPSRTTAADVDAAERSFGFAFPPGYREIVTQLGYGIIDDIARVFPPANCRTDTDIVRSQFESGPRELQWLAANAWLVGYISGVGGLWFEPTSRMLYQERNYETVTPVGRDLLEVIGSALGRRDARPVFEPIDGWRRWMFESRVPSRGSFDDRFDEVVMAFRAVARPDHAKTYGTSGTPNRSVSLYWRAFGGDVTVIKGGAGVSIVLTQDREASDPLLGALFAAADRLGYDRHQHPHDC